MGLQLDTTALTISATAPEPRRQNGTKPRCGAARGDGNAGGHRESYEVAARHLARLHITFQLPDWIVGHGSPLGVRNNVSFFRLVDHFSIGDLVPGDAGFFPDKFSPDMSTHEMQSPFATRRIAFVLSILNAG